MTTPYIIVGGGGHALSLAATALVQDLELLGYTAPADCGPLCPGVPWLGPDTVLAAWPDTTIRLLNGLGSSGDTQPRRQLYEDLARAGGRFAALRHPAALIAALQTDLGPAHQIMAGAIVNAGVQLGTDVLINSGAIVEHGCLIGSHAHIASGAILCGDCRIGEGVHVGAGATVIQGISIGDGAIIASGAVVTRNVESLTLVGGVPGRVLRRANSQQLA